MGMDPSLVRRLNRVNREFYRRHAESFSTTRQAPWPGWDGILDAFADSGPRSVLDLGCGNGRFARYLDDRDRFPDRYVGMDLSPRLIDKARRESAGRDALRRCRWVVGDLIEPWTHADRAGLPLTGPGFDLVILLGVLHHVPGRAVRGALLESAARRVAPGGVLAITVWLFLRSPRLRRRLQRPEELALEDGDYLLPWGAADSGETPMRYVHALSASEAAELSARLPLTPLADFEADGASGNLNRYLLWRREP